MLRNIKLLHWLLILLVVMNAVTIGTILVHNYQEKRNQGDVKLNNVPGGNVLNGKFFRQTLGFDDQQMDSFRQINQAFRSGTRELAEKIEALKEEMFSELKKTVPDTLLLSSYSLSIGKMHGELKMETYKFYLLLKDKCTPEQEAELEKVFLPLFKKEGIHGPANQQNRRGWNKEASQ